MDKVSLYIQSVQPFHFRFLALFFFIFSGIIALLVWGAASQFRTLPEVQSFVAAVPEFEIQNGKIEQEISWEQAIPYSNTILSINTKPDYVRPDKDGIFITHNQIFLTSADITQEYTLPTETIAVTPETINDMLKTSARNLTLLIGGLWFALLWLGYGATYWLTRFCLWALRKTQPSSTVCRSSSVGWTAMIILNVLLIFSGHGLALGTTITLAAGLSLFALLYSGRSNS